jgi:hypothetical protein
MKVGVLYCAYFPSLRRVLFGYIVDSDVLHNHYDFKEISGKSNAIWEDNTIWSIDRDDCFWEITEDEYLLSLICDII